MTKHLAMIMDPLEAIHPDKDTSLALLLEGQRRGYQLFYVKPEQLVWRDNALIAKAEHISVYDDNMHWFDSHGQQLINLGEMDFVFNRIDPPLNLNYFYLTYLLELINNQQCRVVNHPRSVRDVNEKLHTAWFPDLCPASLITRDSNAIMAFLQQHQKIVLKPLNAMGGQGIHLLTLADDNHDDIIASATHDGREMIIAQEFLTNITKGDKRIIMLHGEPVPYGLTRLPANGDFRANLAAGGHGVVTPLSTEEENMCQILGPYLKQKQLYLVGLDVIDNRLTEINVTSPTCIRQIEAATGLNLCDQLFAGFEGKTS